MNIFEEYLRSDFAKEELKKIAEEIPKTPTRYGAIFRTVLDSTTGIVGISFYLRAGIIIETEDVGKVVNKDNVYKWIKNKRPDLSDTDIFKKMQDIMMSPTTERLFRKETKRSPLKIYETTLNLPQFKGKNIGEIQNFLLQLLRNGVFDPILRARDKTSAEIAELGARLKEAESGVLKEYTTTEEEKPILMTDEFLNQQLTSSSSIKKLIVTASNEAWWYINEMDMLIRGPFASIEATMRAQDLEEGFEVEEETIMPEEELEEEMAMAAGINLQLKQGANMKVLLKKLAILADKLDEKNEVTFAEQIDKLITVACYDVTPSYDAVKDAHPKGGATTQLDNKVKTDIKVETLTEQQKKDLEVATKKPTGEQAKITASCKKCGLTHIAYYVNECPSCTAPITPMLTKRPDETEEQYLARLEQESRKTEEEKALDTMQEQRVMI